MHSLTSDLRKDYREYRTTIWYKTSWDISTKRKKNAEYRSPHSRACFQERGSSPIALYHLEAEVWAADEEFGRSRSDVYFQNNSRSRNYLPTFSFEVSQTPPLEVWWESISRLYEIPIYVHQYTTIVSTSRWEKLELNSNIAEKQNSLCNWPATDHLQNHLQFFANFATFAKLLLNFHENC